MKVSQWDSHCAHSCSHSAQKHDSRKCCLISTHRVLSLTRAHLSLLSVHQLYKLSQQDFKTFPYSSGLGGIPGKSSFLIPPAVPQNMLCNKLASLFLLQILSHLWRSCVVFLSVGTPLALPTSQQMLNIYCSITFIQLFVCRQGVTMLPWNLLCEPGLELTEIWQPLSHKCWDKGVHHHYLQDCIKKKIQALKTYISFQKRTVTRRKRPWIMIKSLKI